MLAVRYVALAALVLWLGGMFGEIARQFHFLTYTCGAIILICLLLMKFVGPPPHGFIPRIAIVVMMLAVAVWTDLAARDQLRVALLVNIALGMVLLFWYARE